MARIRSLRPTAWSDPRFVALSRGAQQTLLGIVLVCCDDAGRAPAHPRQVLGALYPTASTITEADVAAELDELAETSLLVRYAGTNGMPYVAVAEWGDRSSPWYQRVDHPSQSLHPEPPRGPREPRASYSANPHETLARPSRDAHPAGEDSNGSNGRHPSGAGDPREPLARPSATDVKGREMEEGEEPPEGVLPPSIPEERKGETLASSARVPREDADYRRRRKRAAEYAQAHPDELQDVERVVDLQLAREGQPARQLLGEELRRTMIVAELLRRANAAETAAAANPR
jgi:hypothetical protein